MAVALAGRANEFEREKRERLTRLHAEEREQLRKLSKLYDDAGKLRATLSNFYNGQVPGWWREIECMGCPSRDEIAEGLR